MIEDDNDVLHKRNFLLMVSPAEGQKLSSMAGFSPASEEVREAELVDIVTRWISLAATGSLRYVQDASEWLAEFITANYGLEEDEAPSIIAAYYAFGVSLISYLMDVEAIEVFPKGDAAKNLEMFTEFLPATFTILTVEDDDDE